MHCEVWSVKRDNLKQCTTFDHSTHARAWRTAQATSIDEAGSSGISLRQLPLRLVRALLVEIKCIKTTSSLCVRHELAFQAPNAPEGFAVEPTHNRIDAAEGFCEVQWLQLLLPVY